jgi:hypothetical protein
MQVIVYTNTNGGVSVCVPTGELDIHAVQAKDTPAGSVIIDDSTLPQGADAEFFNAWTLSGTTVTVNHATATTQATAQLNQLAYGEAQHRAAKVGAGLTNVMADADWATALSTARAAITASTNSAGLLAAIAPVQTAITANAL